MAEDEDKVLRRIRHLFDKASHPNTSQTEADTYAEKAHALMAAHSIEQAMLQDKQISESDVAKRTIHVPAPYAREKAYLLNIIAKRSGCEAISMPRRWRYGKGFHPKRNPKDPTEPRRRKIVFMYGQGADVTIHGFASDLDNVEFLFTNLLLQLSGEIQRGRPLPGEDLGTHRASIMLGFAMSVSERMKRLEKQATNERQSNGRGAEIVLADRRSLVKRAFDASYDDVYGGSSISSSGSGFDAGWDAGQRADLGQQRFSGARKALSS